MKKHYALPILAVALIGSAAVGIAQTSAQDTATSPDKTLVQKLAEKFNLKEADVQQVFDEDKSAHIAAMQKKLEDRLSQAVTDKKITEEQKQKILAKLNELQTQREASHESFKDLTPEQIRTQKEKERTDLEQWAKDNGIDMQYFPVFGKAGMKGDRAFGHGPL